MIGINSLTFSMFLRCIEHQKYVIAPTPFTIYCEYTLLSRARVEHGDKSRAVKELVSLSLEKRIS